MYQKEGEWWSYVIATSERIVILEVDKMTL